jgi:CubicO group peptidase (beta-lactamase class C family)
MKFFGEISSYLRLVVILSFASVTWGWITGVALGADTMPSVRALYDGRLFPDEQVKAFSQFDRFFPTRTVNRGLKVFSLPASQKPLDVKAFKIKVGAQTFNLFDYISMNRVAGLLVLKDGKIAFEDYELGINEATRWVSFSITKAVTTTLIGAAVKDGHIQSLDDPVVKYLPELAKTAYDGVTIRQLLHMASGVQWDETYGNPNSDRRKLLEYQINWEPGAILKYMGSLPRVGAPGSVANYSTGETSIAAALLRAAIKRPLSEYLSEKIWANFGMERDATWWVESPNGLEAGGSGLSVTLRDLGRFGMFVLGDGWVGETKILPDGWMAEATKPLDIPILFAGHKLPYDYGYMWWLPKPEKGEIHKGAYAGAGIFGQFLCVNPREKLVIVMFSSQSKPVPPIPFDFFGAVAEALH